MKKIIWFSRHEPIQKQIDELKHIFGDIEVIQDPNPFSSVDDIVDRFRKNNGDEMVVVAPMTVIDQLLKRGIKPLYAEMELVQGDDFDVEANGRRFKFVKFSRITDIIIKKEELI